MHLLGKQTFKTNVLVICPFLVEKIVPGFHSICIYMKACTYAVEMSFERNLHVAVSFLYQLLLAVVASSKALIHS